MSQQVLLSTKTMQLPPSVVATIFTKLWKIDRRGFFNLFLSWSALEDEETIEIVLKELPVVDILANNGWDRELEFLSQQFKLLGIEFQVQGLLFYSPCVSIFRNEDVAENLEILSALAPAYPLARFAKNIFSIFYQTYEANVALDDLIEMTMVPHICAEIGSMIKIMRRIQDRNRTWEVNNGVFSYDRIALLCNGWIDDEVKHFKPCIWRSSPNPDARCVQCRSCKAAIVLFMFSNSYYEDDGMHVW